MLGGNDRRAAADLRRDDQVRRIVADAGIPSPDRGLAPHSFRDFRDEFAARTGGPMAWHQHIRAITRELAVATVSSVASPPMRLILSVT